MADESRIREAAAAHRRGVEGLLGGAASATSCTCSAAATAARIALLPARAVPALPVDRRRVGALRAARGTVYTFTVTHQNQAPGFRDELPYVLAYVELDEGVRMLTNIVDCAPDAVRIGMPVEVVFEDVTPEVTLPKFKPAG